jgi:hypothetical protein
MPILAMTLQQLGSLAAASTEYISVGLLIYNWTANIIQFFEKEIEQKRSIFIILR